MDSYEMSKIGGAILAALLLIFVPRTLIDMQKQAHKGEKPGFTLPDPAAVASDTAAPAGDAKAPAAGGAVSFAEANAESGKATFSKCAACHTVTKGGAAAVGPNLWGIVGRKIGGVDGFSYSPALKKKAEEGLTWDAQKLAQWVEADDKLFAGNKMIFAGIADKAAQADLVAYLNTLSDSPAPLPK